MKKFLFSVLMLSAALVSCTKSEVIEVVNGDAPIQFNPYTGRTPVTKAPSIENAEQFAPYGFKVYGYLNNGNVASYTTPYMDKNVTGRVTTTEGENSTTTIDWQYDGVSYWPGTIPLDFVAYGLNTNLTGDADDNLVTENSISQDNQNPSITYTVYDNVSLQRDLLVAIPVEDQQYTDANGGVVSLEFKHMLSRVSFSLLTKDGNDVPVTIEKVDLIGKFIPSGIVDLTAQNPAISGTASSENITYKFLGDKGTFTSKAGEKDDDNKSIADPIYDNSLSYYKEVGTLTTGGANETQTDDYYEAILSYVDSGETKHVVKKGDNYYPATKDSDGKWTVVETAATIPTGTTPALAFAEENQAKKNERYMMIIPTDKHGAVLDVKYFLPYAGSFDALNQDGSKINLSNINFEAGKSYEFRLKVSTNAIDFDVVITPWVEGSYGNDGNNKQVIELN